MTILDYYEGIAAAKRKRNAANYDLDACRDMTPDRLSHQYGSYVVASKKKKGADKGYKLTYKWQWRDYAGYRRALRELFPREYALLCCREDMDIFTSDRWWDTPDYRAEAIKDYRDGINAIRREYGLTRAEVAPYMRVS